MAKLWQKDAPIIRSALETDVYKILMLYYIWVYYPYLQVSWAFKNRKTTIPLTQYVPIGALREELQAVMALRFSEANIAYLRLWGMFPEKFLRKLALIRLSMPEIREENGQLSIEVRGSWFETTLWEIYILAIVAELYGRGKARAHGISEAALATEGLRRIREKVDFFTVHPELRFALFGLRRRFSGPWEDQVTALLLNETTAVTGTSNIYLAQRFGVEPIGTNAHELPMVEYALARHESPLAVCQAPYEVLRKWQRIYGHKALIMLSDTFGTDAFLRDLPAEYAWLWRGHRQDSGDPLVVGEKIIAHYDKLGINPLDKVILFTDGLTPQRMLDIFEHFTGRIGIGYGLGTNITNDLGLITALSIVMKLQTAAGNPTVKLSDNRAKAMGPMDEVAKAIEIFGYTSSFTEATTY